MIVEYLNLIIEKSTLVIERNKTITSYHDFWE